MLVVWFRLNFCLYSFDDVSYQFYIHKVLVPEKDKPTGLSQP
jgi:hypothetical protein